MTGMLKNLAAFIIRYSGLGFAIRETAGRRKVTIVLYHRPEPERFRKHLDYMSRRYRFIRLDELVDALHNRDWSKIPPKALVMTFDDGMKETFALSGMFREYGVTPTFYVSTGVVGTSRRFWFSPYSYGEVAEMRILPGAARAAMLKKTGFDREMDYPGREALSGEELSAMKACVDFQSHGRFHEPLTSCSLNEKSDEIIGSMEEMKKLTGRPAFHFSFPHGDYDEEDIKILKGCGYRSARSVDCGRNGPDADPYRLKITGVNDYASVTLLAADLSGIIGRLGKFRQGSLTGRHTAAKPGRDVNRAVASEKA